MPSPHILAIAAGAIKASARKGVPPQSGRAKEAEVDIPGALPRAGAPSVRAVKRAAISGPRIKTVAVPRPLAEVKISPVRASSCGRVVPPLTKNDAIAPGRKAMP